ncbi:MAG: glycosyltransferase [Planctomycetes bacterium]|nr:glycosyltransferase [Planctomycetota bacterium]
MRVLHLCHQFLPETRGGVESYVADLIGAQQAAGHDVEVITGSQAPWPQIGFERYEYGGVPVHRLHRDDLFFDLYAKSWHPGVADALENFLASHHPEVVHVHQWIRLTTDLVHIVQRCGIAAVVTLHDHYLSCPRAFRLRPDGEVCFRPLSPASCRDCVPRYGHESVAEIDAGIDLFAQQGRSELELADAVLVGVDATAELLSRALAVPRTRFRTLPLGYRRRFPGEPMAAPPHDGEPLRFGFWGGVAPHKGIAVLVEAVRRLVATPPPRRVELHVLGGFATPKFEQQLRAAAGGLPVTFHGRFETAQLRSSGLHVGVFPSTCLETFGIVLDECFEMGLPCIVADRGALPDRAGRGGLVTPAGDPAALAAAMRRFVDEPGLWSALRTQLPPLPPDLDAHVRQLDTVYAEAIVARKKAPPPRAGVSLAARAALLRLQRESALLRVPSHDLR